MKTTNNLKTMRSYIKIAFISAAILVSSFYSSAQNSSISFEIGRDISGSGLGGNVCPAITLTGQKLAVSIGPNFQRKKMNFSGVQTNFRYTVAKSYNEKKELFFSGNVTAHFSAHLSPGNIEIEKSSNPESNFDYDGAKYRVIESYVGVGLKLNPLKQFSTCFNVGIGGFNTFDKNYNREMFREKVACVIQCRVSLFYNFTKR